MWFPICCFIGLRRAYTDWLALMAFDAMEELSPAIKRVTIDHVGNHVIQLHCDKNGLGPSSWDPTPDLTCPLLSRAVPGALQTGTGTSAQRQWVALERTTAGAKIAMKRPEATQTTKEGGVPPKFDWSGSDWTGKWLPVPMPTSVRVAICNPTELFGLVWGGVWISHSK